MSSRIIVSLIAFLLSFSANASIQIRGGTGFNTIIPNGDTSPVTLDGTDFGEVNVPGSKTVSFQAKAIGTQETIVDILEDGAAWSIASGGGFGTVSAGSARTFSVKLEPISGGFKNATVTIVTTTANYTFLVKGNGVGESEIVVRGQLASGQPFTNLADGDTTPSQSDGTAFGGRGVSSGSVSHTFQIENTGTDQLVIDSITDDSGEFSISGAPSTVGVGNTATFSVKFNPSSSGNKSATITILNNDPDGDEGTYTFDVSGFGEASQIQVLGGDSQTVNIPVGDTSPRTTDNTDFGSVVAGSAPLTNVFKIKNNGNEDLFVTLVSEDAIAFNITGAPSPIVAISPGGSNNFNIILDTSTAGPKNGTVTIQSNDPDNGIFTFDITAQATGDPEIVVRGQLNSLTNFINIGNNSTSPNPSDGTDFGSQGVDDGFVEHLFEIENTGNARLNIASISDDSAAFSVVSVPDSVAAGNSKTFGVRFNPGAFGEKIATITIDNDDPDGGEDPYTFQVRGVGLFPKAQLYGGANLGEFIANNDDSPITADGTDFGIVAANSGSKTNTFRIKNEGNQSLTLLAISENGAAFSIASQPALPTTIAAGGSLDLSILFAPTSAGSKAATVTVQTNDTVQGRDTYTFDLIGEASGVAEFTVAGKQLPILPFQAIANGDLTPEPIDGTDFEGRLVAAGGLTRSFQITNTGSAQLTINSITEGSPNFSLSNLPSVVGVNQSKTFDVTFNPIGFGDKTANIKISTNAGGEEDFTFRVAGLGEAPQLEFWNAASEVGFEGEQIFNGDDMPSVEKETYFRLILDGGTSYIVHTFQVRNTGNVPLRFTNASLSGPAFFFAEPFGTTSILYSNRLIQPGGFEEIKIAFGPERSGEKAGTLTLISGDPENSTFIIDLAGNATGESDLLVSGQLNEISPFVPVPDGSFGASTGNGTEFGDQGVGDGSLSHTFQIKNTGYAKLNITSIVETSPHFSITSAPTSITVGAIKDFTINFNPTSLGEKSATVTVNSDAPGDKASYTFTVRGIGEAPDIALKGGTNFAQDIPNDSITPRDENGTDFGNVNVDSSVVTRTFRIANQGNDSLNIMNSISDNPDFVLADIPSPATFIAPGSSRDITIEFDPSGTGFRTGLISIFSNDPDEIPFTFVVEGFGTNDSPEITVTGSNNLRLTDGDTVTSPLSGTDFGNVDITGATQVRLFQIENTGTGTLDVSSITDDGARFNITGVTTGVLLPGESLDFEVRFNPNTEVLHTATVTINSNDDNEGSFTFVVQGTGTTTAPPAEPEIGVTGGQALTVNINSGDSNPRRFDGTNFGSIIVGETKTRTFRIANRGDALLAISQVRVIGVPGAVSSFPSSVAPGAFADFTVELTPQSAGQRNFTLQIVSDDPDESPFTFALTGLGVDPANMLKITDFIISGPNLQVTFISDPTKTYRIAFSTDLLNWNRPNSLRGLPGDINPQPYLVTGIVGPAYPKVFIKIEEE